MISLCMESTNWSYLLQHNLHLKVNIIRTKNLTLRNIRIHESNRTKFVFFYFLYITFYNLLPKKLINYSKIRLNINVMLFVSSVLKAIKIQTKPVFSPTFNISLPAIFPSRLHTNVNGLITWSGRYLLQMHISGGIAHRR